MIYLYFIRNQYDMFMHNRYDVIIFFNFSLKMDTDVNYLVEKETYLC